MGAHLERAIILCQQSRPDLAERELRQELAADPDNALAHAFLALCLAEGEKPAPAMEEARAAITLGPDLPFAHYVAARVLHAQERLKEAEEAALEAIRLDGEDADYFALLAGIRLDRGQTRAALAAAEEGLALDPENVACVNLRSMALVKLGRKSEATDTLEAALARDPEDPVTHANVGWALLHRAEYPGAVEHFREALRLAPNLDSAREGIVEALKAKHFLYGLMLRYFLWMSRLSGRAQWGVILAGYFGYRLLRDLARGNPALAPWITPLLVAYGAFAVLTWIAQPLFDLLLRLNRFGRLSLSRDQLAASNWLATCLLAILFAIGAWLVSGQSAMLLAALLAVGLTLPATATFRCRPGWPRRAMAAYGAGLAALGIAGIALQLASSGQRGAIGGTAAMLLGTALVGAFLSGWVANILVSVRPKGGARAQR